MAHCHAPLYVFKGSVKHELTTQPVVHTGLKKIKALLHIHHRLQGKGAHTEAENKDK